MSQDLFDNFFRNVLGLPGSDPRVHGARATGRCCSPTPRSTAGPAHFSARVQEFRSGAKEYKGVTSSILRRKVAKREIKLNRQRRALRVATGAWKAEDHPELAGGAAKWIREMRQESVKRYEKVERYRKAE